VSDQLLTLDLSPAPRSASGTPSPQEATAALQQLVWTATAAAGRRCGRSGSPSTARGSLFGLVALDRPFDRQFEGDPRAPVWVIDPAEGAQVGPRRAHADGRRRRHGRAAVRVRLLRGASELAAQDVPLTPLPGAAGPVRPGQRGGVAGAGVAGGRAGHLPPRGHTRDADGREWIDTKTFRVG
jgi:hypothetical protein